MRNKIKILSVAAIMGLALNHLPSSSLTVDGDRVMPDGRVLVRGSAEWQNQMQVDGLVALYLFRETSGPVLDLSGYRNSNGDLEPLNLTIDDPDSGGPSAEVRRPGSHLAIDFPTLVRSSGPAAKIHRECRASQQLSVETWISNRQDSATSLSRPLSIVTLSNQREANRDNLSSTNRNFFLAQEYDEGPRYRAILRTSSSADTRDEEGAFIRSAAGVAERNVLQHVVMTRFRDVAAGGREVTRLYASERSDSGQTLDLLREEVVNDGGLSGTFNNWDANAVLGIGNEISYASPLARRANAEDRFTTEQRGWTGDLYLVAVYCKALETEDILGARAPVKGAFQNLGINPAEQVTQNLEKASTLYRRLTGTTLPVTSPLIKDMAQRIQGSGETGLMEAAALATNQRDFYNITVRDFASRMSTRDETVNTDLNDFSATLIGIVRDNINAKQLLTADFMYIADQSKAAVPSRMQEDILTSNAHYVALEEGRFNLAEVLVQVPQTIFDGREVRPHPNAAGLLTTRAWMEAHATAGTNRRLVEYAFRQFLCIPMDKWSDSYAPDDYVGRDIDRFPAGDNTNYTTTCRACHSTMDSLRGAFAFYDFSNGFAKYSWYMTPAAPDAEDTPTTIRVTNPQTMVVAKMNHNDLGRGGRETRDSYFFNNATTGVNGTYFQWSGRKEGYGVKDFGDMLSNSSAFPTCMAQRVFRSVCKREPASFDRAMINRVAQDFVSSNFNLKTLFQRVAISTECVGQ